MRHTRFIVPYPSLDRSLLKRFALLSVVGDFIRRGAKVKNPEQSFWGYFGLFAGVLTTMVTTTSGATVWLLNLFDAHAKWGTPLYLLFVILAGVVLPSLFIVTAALAVILLTRVSGSLMSVDIPKPDLAATNSVVGDKKDALVDRVHALEQILNDLTPLLGRLSPRSATSELSRRGPQGTNCFNRVLYCLDQCRLSIQLEAVELRTERSERLSKAKEEHLQAVHWIAKFGLHRYQQDKKLLYQMDPADECGLIKEYVRIKEAVLHSCSEAEEILGAKTATNEHAKDSMVRACSKLLECCDLIDNGIARLTNESTRVV